MSDDEAAPSPGPELVVGIGASAGGLQAFKQLLAVLPADTGLAFVLVQHLDPTHESLLSELLAARTDMPVHEVEQGMRLRPDTVYVIRPDCALAVRGGRVELTEPTLHRGVRLPVDHLFRSLAREYGPRSVGVVLSGAGSDGSAGLRDLKSAGGLAIAQEPDSSGQAGMPQSAIDTGLVDLVLAIEDMPAALVRFARLPPAAVVDPSNEAQALQDEDAEDAENDRDDGDTDGRTRGDGASRAPSGGGALRPGPAALEPDGLARLTAMLEAQLGFDLRVYKRGTVERRVLRRMLLSGFEEVDPWLDHLRGRPDDQRLLVRDLMISVTNFLRDPEAWAALREHAIEPLVAQANAGANVRVWVAGCATGEEAYSIGMELLEAAESVDKRLELEIFATDVDQDALSYARTGIYPSSIAEHVSARRLRHHFTPVEGGGYKVRSSLRDLVSFASHDLTKDPPFSRMDIVSCRNVMIYLTHEAQARVLDTLHFALRADGHLLLSTSESVGPRRERFQTVSKAARLYRRVGTSPVAPISRSRPSGGRTERGERKRNADAARQQPRPGAPDPMARAVLEACVPPTLVVDEAGTVRFVHGELGPWLRFPQGDEPRLEIGACLRPDIATRVRGVLYRCRRSGTLTVARLAADGGTPRARIVARPAPRLGDGTVVLSFEPDDADTAGAPEAAPERAGATPDAAPAVAARPAGNAADGGDGDNLLKHLEYELRATREDLRNTVEELETSNEELRSANEESMSMNEELQSGNEELEATTEELRSLNEELTTVNAQLREKLDELEQTNDDLGNFFASARIAIVFMDERLRIKRFTPAAAKLLGIDQADVGRFSGDIARELLQDELEPEAREVLDKLAERTRELRTRDGRWFTRRILPYRTENRRIEGVVVTLSEITELKRAAERLAARERQQAVIARLGLAALRELDLQGFMDLAVREVATTLELDFCKVLELQPGAERLLLRAGVGWNDGIVDAAAVDNDEGSQAGYTLTARTPVLVEDLGTESRFTGPRLLDDHGITSGLSCAIMDGTEAYGVLGGHMRRARAFSTEDAVFLQAVANVIGSAVGRHLNARRLALEHELSRALVSADDLAGVLTSLQRRAGLELDIELVEVRSEPPDGATPALLTDALLHAGTPQRADALERAFAQRVDGGPDDVPARALALDRPVWMTDAGTPKLFAADPAMRALGFRTAFGFPVRSRERTLGAVALYSRARLPANATLRNSLEAIGTTLGEFGERMELARHGARLAAIVRSSHDAILSYDRDCRITEWLLGAERLYGFSAKEMLGEPLERLIPAERREAARAVAERTFAGELVEPFETVRLTRAGELVQTSVTSSPIRDGDGNIVGVSSIERDIGRLKRTERRLLEADQQKDEFLAMLGHELRNPLASIRTAVELLDPDGAEDGEMRRTRAILERQSAHMARLLDGLLDVSRIVQGKIELARDGVDLSGVCREVIEDSAARSRGAGLTLTGRLPEAAVRVHGDRVRLVQVVDNLLSNAIRYTREGGEIELTLAREGERAVLTIRDTGIGIDAALLPHVFDIFRQSRRSLDRTDGGLGLGLSLVRSIVELHGGTVTAASDGEDRGSAFTVALPVATGDVSTLVRIRPETVAIELDVLLVEDDADVGEVLARALRRLGHRVRHAVNGRVAIAMAMEAPPDVVVCDLGLPDGTSGYDVAVALRAEAPTRSVRLVALTGYGGTEDRARSATAGFDEHLVKPVSIAVLRDALARVRERTRA